MATLVPDLVAHIAANGRVHAAFLARALEALGAEELADLEGYLDHCLAEGATVPELAADYKVVVDDALREQIHFRRHGRYRFSRYEEVAASVYHDARFMTAYMRGLAITSFFWPNHAKIRRFFEAELGPSARGRYLEVGPGHGFHFLSALRRGAFDACEGIDVSAASVALTGRLLAARGYPGATLHVGDFLDVPLDPGFDWVVMGEVLEHVERPDRFLARARELTHPASTIFVTTCANSPASDHIYLFRSVEEIEALVSAEGLRVARRLVLPHEGTTLAESEAQRLAVNVALVLRHA